MEVGEVIQAPAGLEAVFGRYRLGEARRHGRRTENHHIQPPGRGVVNPFRGKEAYAVQGGEIDLLGPDEVVVGGGAQVVDVVGQEGVTGGLRGEEN